MDKFKNCPFCGSDNLTPHLSDYGTPSWVRCEECKALVFFPWNNCCDSLELASTWNRRADEWIHVKDRLPEPWANVLVYGERRECEVVMYDVDINGWQCESGCDSLENRPWWMPLPEPPKEET